MLEATCLQDYAFRSKATSDCEWTCRVTALDFKDLCERSCEQILLTILQGHHASVAVNPTAVQGALDGLPVRKVKSAPCIPTAMDLPNNLCCCRWFEGAADGGSVRKIKSAPCIPSPVDPD